MPKLKSKWLDSEYTDFSFSVLLEVYFFVNPIKSIPAEIYTMDQQTQSFVWFWDPEKKTQTSNKDKDEPLCALQLCSFLVCKINRIVLARLMHIINIVEDWMKFSSPYRIVYTGWKTPKLSGQSNKTDNNVKPSICSLNLRFSFVSSFAWSTHQFIQWFNIIRICL